MNEVMSGRMSQADGMVEMEKAREMTREEACARITHPEHRWEDCPWHAPASPPIETPYAEVGL